MHRADARWERGSGVSLLSPDQGEHLLSTVSGGQVGLFLGEDGRDVCFLGGLQPDPNPGAAAQAESVVGTYWNKINVGKPSKILCMNQEIGLCGTAIN